MQKISFRAAKDHLLQAKRRPFGKPRKTALCNGSSLPPKNAAMISAEISDGEKAETAQAAERLSAAAKCNTAGEKDGSTDKKNHSKNMRRKGRKTPQAENHAAAQPENKAAATPYRTHIIYIAHNAPKTANKR